MKIKNKILWLSLSVLPQASHAASIEGILRNTIKYLQGPVAKSVGVAAIIISGYLCLAKQKLPKETFVMILVGMGIIFGGSSLYNTLIG
ncbi:MAG: TrbC/VirB2 family protein [Legionella sp.]|nr:TrbC/VirB2 family protein [Legionella sp.]